MLCGAGWRKKYWAKISAESQYEKLALCLTVACVIPVTGLGFEPCVAWGIDGNIDAGQTGCGKRLQIIPVFHCARNIIGLEIERGTKLESV
jgi:hypothetical protein